MKPNKIKTAVSWFCMLYAVFARFSDHDNSIYNSPWHIEKISCQYTTSDSLRSTAQDSTQCPHTADECKFFSGQSILVCPCVRVHKRTLLMNSFLLLQQCQTCLTWEVCEIGGK